MTEIISSLKQDKELLQHELTKKAELVCDFLQDKLRPGKVWVENPPADEFSHCNPLIPLFLKPESSSRGLGVFLDRDLRCCTWNLLEPLSRFVGHSPERSNHHWHHSCLHLPVSFLAPHSALGIFRASHVPSSWCCCCLGLLYPLPTSVVRWSTWCPVG